MKGLNSLTLLWLKNVHIELKKEIPHTKKTQLFSEPVSKYQWQSKASLHLMGFKIAK